MEGRFEAAAGVMQRRNDDSAARGGLPVSFSVAT